MMNPDAAKTALLTVWVKWACITMGLMILWVAGFAVGREFERGHQEGRREAQAVASLAATAAKAPNGFDGSKAVDYCFITADMGVSPTDPLGPEVEVGWTLWGHIPRPYHRRRPLEDNKLRRETLVETAAKYGCALREPPNE